MDGAGSMARGHWIDGHSGPRSLGAGAETFGVILPIW